ncbi:MAG: ABC transporter ATP-binding protein [Spirochaetaceae bacterium]|nr:MAG: ABC transporter ATP-binding protein [Spirochaetaceae bacterium]
MSDSASDGKIPEQGTELLKLQDVELAYRRGPVVLRLQTESIRAGEVLALVGPNGGGKTTLLRCAAGLLKPQTGTVRLHGRPLYGKAAMARDERARHLAVVLTDPVAPAYLKVREVVELGRISRPSGRKTRENAVEQALELSGAVAIADRQLGSLSDGERQRVMLARALAQEPRLLVLDEPAAHLDPPHQTSLFLLLRSLIRDGVIEAAAVATHHLHLALHFSDRLMLVNGKTQSATPAAFMQSGELGIAFAEHQNLRLDPEKGWFVPVDQGSNPAGDFDTRR